MKTLAITQGDPAGVGPEIVAKAFRDAPEDLRGCFVVGDIATLRRAAQAIARPGVPSVPVALIGAPAEALAVPDRCIPVLALPGIPGPQPWGQVSAAAGRAAADCVVWAARAALRGEVAGLVTAVVAGVITLGSLAWHRTAARAQGTKPPDVAGVTGGLTNEERDRILNQAVASASALPSGFRRVGDTPATTRMHKMSASSAGTRTRMIVSKVVERLHPWT